MNKNKIQNLWIYAIILFMSAFIVLLFTAYSQIKTNENIDKYKSELQNKDVENNEYKQNFSSAQEMNTKLTEEINFLKEENSNLKAELDELRNYKVNARKTISEKRGANESLFRAIYEYLNENYVLSAEIIKGVEKTVLDTKAADTYDFIMPIVYETAGKTLLDEGITHYKREEYNQAVEKLNLSYIYAPDKDFSDKCLYYLAYSEHKCENDILALVHMKQLINEYSYSQYINSAKKFIKKYDQ